MPKRAALNAVTLCLRRRRISWTRFCVASVSERKVHHVREEPARRRQAGCMGRHRPPRATMGRGDHARRFGVFRPRSRLSEMSSSHRTAAKSSSSLLLSPSSIEARTRSGASGRRPAANRLLRDASTSKTTFQLVSTARDRHEPHCAMLMFRDFARPRRRNPKVLPTSHRPVARRHPGGARSPRPQSPSRCSEPHGRLAGPPSTS